MPITTTDYVHDSRASLTSLPESEEEWRSISGYEGIYEVSNRGRVRSIDRILRRVEKKRCVYQRREGQILVPHHSETSRAMAQLRKDGHAKRWAIDRLVAHAFIGPRPDGHYIHHRNGNVSDNSASNLEYLEFPPTGLAENDETWRPISGYEGIYEVSDKGRVRSLDRILHCVEKTGYSYQRRKGKILAAHHSKAGRALAELRKDGHAQHCAIHRLVAHAFMGPRPSGHYIHHRNGNVSDNRVSNLEYLEYHTHADGYVRGRKQEPAYKDGDLALLTSQFSFLSDFTKTRRHLRMLGITNVHLQGIDSLIALQSLAKKEYYKACQYLHPDTSTRRKGLNHLARPPGQTFQKATEAYRWILSLTERDLVRLERQSKRRYIRIGSKFRGSVSLLHGTVYDCPLPWHFSKGRDYGYGYHESTEHLLWQ